MLRNAIDHWGSMAKSLHWLVVVLILVEVPAGFLMAGTYGLSFRDKEGLALHNLLSQIHHTIGFLILAVVIARLVWRLTYPAPAAITSFAGQAWISWLTHAGLYALLLILPLSGWASLSAFGGAPIWFFDHAELVPPIVPKAAPGSDYGYRLFAGIHGWAYKIGAILLVLHVGAALWHHFVRRDRVLRRMWPLGSDPDRTAEPHPLPPSAVSVPLSPAAR